MYISSHNGHYCSADYGNNSSKEVIVAVYNKESFPFEAIVVDAHTITITTLHHMT